jgi:creatinine amidohydrolase/Fe(II)-dependent formamide hydrolase-like protein
MKAVAAELTAQWAGANTTVHFIPEYYDFYNQGALSKWLEAQGIREVDEGHHDNVAITAMMMAVDPETVRMRERRAAGRFSINGVKLDPAQKTIALGRKAVAYRADVTVQAIKRALEGR